jgi:hypothetical protein
VGLTRTTSMTLGTPHNGFSSKATIHARGRGPQADRGNIFAAIGWRGDDIARWRGRDALLGVGKAPPP